MSELRQASYGLAPTKVGPPNVRAEDNWEGLFGDKVKGGLDGKHSIDVDRLLVFDAPQEYMSLESTPPPSNSPPGRFTWEILARFREGRLIAPSMSQQQPNNLSGAAP